jgi:DNA-binding phage protein
MHGIVFLSEFTNKRCQFSGCEGRSSEIGQMRLAIQSGRHCVYDSSNPHAARLILRDLVNASVGFEVLAAETKTPSKSLHRMLSERGNPSMDNLAAIFGVVRKRLGVDIRAHAVKAA